ASASPDKSVPDIKRARSRDRDEAFEARDSLAFAPHSFVDIGCPQRCKSQSGTGAALRIFRHGRPRTLNSKDCPIRAPDSKARCASQNWTRPHIRARGKLLAETKGGNSIIRSVRNPT